MSLRVKDTIKGNIQSADKVNNALTFTGGVTGTYNGSAAKSVAIPTTLKSPYALTISLNGSSQGAFDGSAAKSINVTPASIGASATSHEHETIKGIYTSNGGAQPPSYIPNGKVRFNMMNSFKGLSSPGGYMDCMMMETYTGGDVPVSTAFGIRKVLETPRAWLAVGEKGNTETWKAQTEIITDGNIGSKTASAAKTLATARKIGNASFNGSADISLSSIGAAPTSHASSATTYGVGTAANYGHVKLSDEYTTSSGNAASNSIAASGYALYRAYSALKTAVDGKLASSHADAKATASTFSHVKLSDSYTSSGGAASAGVGASSLALYNAYTALKSLVDGKSSTSHTHTSLVVPDTRDVNSTPNEKTKTASFEFKTRSTVNNPGPSSTYVGLFSFLPWSDKSGGNGYQVSFGYSNATTPSLNIRTATIGDSSWGAWHKIYTSADKPTPADIGAASKVELDEVKKVVADAKTAIATAITEAGYKTSPESSLELLTYHIQLLAEHRYSAGKEDGIAETKKGTATAADVLSGKTFTNSSGLVTGTMANLGELNWSKSNTEESVTAGYRSGGKLSSKQSYTDGQNSVKNSPNSYNLYTKSQYDDRYTTGYNAGVSAGGANKYKYQNGSGNFRLGGSYQTTSFSSVVAVGVRKNTGGKINGVSVSGNRIWINPSQDYDQVDWVAIGN